MFEQVNENKLQKKIDFKMLLHGSVTLRYGLPFKPNPPSSTEETNSEGERERERHF